MSKNQRDEFVKSSLMHLLRFSMSPAKQNVYQHRIWNFREDPSFGSWIQLTALGSDNENLRCIYCLEDMRVLSGFSDYIPAHFYRPSIKGVRFRGGKGFPVLFFDKSYRITKLPRREQLDKLEKDARGSV